MKTRRYPKRRTRSHPRFPLKNKFEDSAYDQIGQHEQPVYEKYRTAYTVLSYYTPDFVLENGIVIEVKGYFTPEDRNKLLMVKRQHPELDIRLLLEDGTRKLNKASHTTLADWCDKHGFPHAVKEIPAAWFAEQKTEAERIAIMAALEEKGAKK